jgi:hypothetical protein
MLQSVCYFQRRNTAEDLGCETLRSKQPGDIPWQQFINPIDWMLGDTPEHFAQIRLRV